MRYQSQRIDNYQCTARGAGITYVTILLGTLIRYINRASQLGV